MAAATIVDDEEELPQPLPSGRRSRRPSQSDGRQSKGKVGETEAKSVFVDAAAMKEKVRQNLSKPQHNVMNFYKDKGCAQCLARSNGFSNVTMAIISLNALWLALDTDYNDQDILLDAHPAFQVGEHFFCAFFAFEWMVRFIAFKRKRDGIKDTWFIFDSVLVALMVLEVWAMNIFVACVRPDSIGNTPVLTMARLLRLLRMARIGKLLRSVPELMILVKGMAAACRSVLFTLLLLLLLIYVCAIGFTQLTAGTEAGETYFSTVPDSMYTLFVYGTLLDSVALMAGKLREGSLFHVMAFFFFILIAALTIMNLLVGVLCEVVNSVAATEKEEMMLHFVHRKVKQIVEELDENGDGGISKTEFVQIMENWDAVKALQDVGVDVVGLVDFADIIFEDGAQEITFEKFMDVVLQLRGTNSATVKDIVELRKLVRTNNMQTNYVLSRIEGRICGHVDQIAAGAWTPTVSTKASTNDPWEVMTFDKSPAKVMYDIDGEQLPSLPMPSGYQGHLLRDSSLESAPSCFSYEVPNFAPIGKREDITNFRGTWTTCIPGEGVNVCKAMLEQISVYAERRSGIASCQTSPERLGEHYAKAKLKAGSDVIFQSPFKLPKIERGESFACPSEPSSLAVSLEPIPDEAGEPLLFEKQHAHSTLEREAGVEPTTNADVASCQSELHNLKKQVTMLSKILAGTLSDIQQNQQEWPASDSCTNEHTKL